METIINESSDRARLLYEQNEKLNAKSMAKVLHVFSNTQSVEEVSIKQLDRIYQLNVDDQSLFNKRFDFVDLKNKRIYEFDGDHHFKFIEHFHETYDTFIKQRRRDMIKQRFVVDYGFDLVRITGNLTVHQFIDILVRLNLQAGQSLFIKDDYYQVLDTQDLNCELDLVDMLQAEIVRLNQKLQEKSSQEDVEDINEDDNEANNTNDNKDNKDDEMLVEFLDDIKHEFVGIRYVSDLYLYSRYKDWHIANMSNRYSDSRKFKVNISKLMLKFGYVYEYGKDGYRKIRDFGVKTFNVDDCFDYTRSLVSDQLRDKHRKQTYYELKSGYITEYDLQQMKLSIDDDIEKTFDNDRDQLIYRILLYRDSH